MEVKAISINISLKKENVENIEVGNTQNSKADIKELLDALASFLLFTSPNIVGSIA